MLCPSLSVADCVLAQPDHLAFHDGDPQRIHGSEQRGAEDVILVLLVFIGDGLGKLVDVGRDTGAVVLKLEDVALAALGLCPRKAEGGCHGVAVLLAQLLGAAHDLGEIVHRETSFCWAGVSGLLCTAAAIHRVSASRSALVWLSLLSTLTSLAALEDRSPFAVIIYYH